MTWRTFDPRLGNYDDCGASFDLSLAEQFVGVDLPHEIILGWQQLDGDRTAFLIEGDDGDQQVWTVTIDRDADYDGDRMVDCSACVAVTVTRGGELS